MDCREIRELVSARIDGQSSAAADRRIDAHLAACEACRRAERWMRTMNEGVSVEGAAASPGFRSALFGRLEREELLPPRRGRRFAFPSLRWAAVPLAAAAALAVFVLAGRQAGVAPPGAGSAPSLVARQDAGPDGAPGTGSVPRQAGISATSQAAHAVSGVAKPSLPSLSAEEAEIVANLDLLEHASALDEAPAGFEDMLSPSAKERS